MDKHTAERFSNFEQKLQAFPEVVSCSIVTGRSEDYLIKAVVRDMAHYEEFLLHRLNRIEGISQVHTGFELRKYFRAQSWRDNAHWHVWVSCKNFWGNLFKYAF